MDRTAQGHEHLTDMRRLRLFAHTLPFLKAQQIYWRLYLILARSTHRIRPAPDPLSLPQQRLIEPIERPSSWTGHSFRFLNQEIAFQPIAWNRPDLPKLWLYNLHYFDCLQQPGLESATGLTLIRDWIEHNPAFAGNGWEPYPLSLRIVNWLKFLARESVDPATERLITESLYQQAKHLRRSLEYHLLANHLFKNGVALLFAGTRLQAGAESDAWLRKALEILDTELSEQILPDGGHFERSPMYHAITLEDVLDCLNALEAWQDSGRSSSTAQAALDLLARLRETAARMLRFLADIVHPDGTLPRFNDSAEGVASRLDQLQRYAERLDIAVSLEPEHSSLLEKPDFGLCILSRGSWRCILDSGAIGPDYQPGHAHCDTLSYELTLDGRLVAVNAGTYAYAGPQRNRFRSTCSHNTLEIDGQEQHELWATFRVARRGYPQRIRLWSEDDQVCFSGEHTGYRRLPGRPIHRRHLRLSTTALDVQDSVLSKTRHRLHSRIHLHPDVRVQNWNHTQAELEIQGGRLRLRVDQGRLSVEDYEFSREFGLREPAKVLVIDNASGLEPNLSYRLGVE